MSHLDCWGSDPSCPEAAAIAGDLQRRGTEIMQRFPLVAAVIRGRSFSDIARDEGCQPSTIMRRWRKEADQIKKDHGVEVLPPPTGPHQTTAMVLARPPAKDVTPPKPRTLEDLAEKVAMGYGIDEEDACLVCLVGGFWVELAEVRGNNNQLMTLTVDGQKFKPTIGARIGEALRDHGFVERAYEEMVAEAFRVAAGE